jgi:Flp pilus assembly protein TadB
MHEGRGHKDVAKGEESGPVHGRSPSVSSGRALGPLVKMRAFGMTQETKLMSAHRHAFCSISLADCPSDRGERSQDEEKRRTTFRNGHGRSGVRVVVVGLDGYVLIVPVAPVVLVVLIVAWFVLKIFVLKFFVLKVLVLKVWILHKVFNTLSSTWRSK